MSELEQGWQRVGGCPEETDDAQHPQTEEFLYMHGINDFRIMAQFTENNLKECHLFRFLLLVDARFLSVWGRKMYRFSAYGRFRLKMHLIVWAVSLY